VLHSNFIKSFQLHNSRLESEVHGDDSNFAVVGNPDDVVVEGQR
jgi:hypothetical protein